ncbi:MAG: hypothetical protein DMD43_09135, partial [Gemmatimonadetes bacterium]
MVKTKVQDIASELGVAPEQLMTLLKEMHVFARGPQSSLEDDQVAALRVRWEREKRKQKEEPPKKPKRRAAKAAAAEPAPPPAEPAVRPSKRRRTAAEVAEVEAQAELERQAEAAAAAAFDLERPVLEKLELPEPTGLPMPTIEERARALFKELPPLPAEAETTEEEVRAEQPPEPPTIPLRPAPPPAQPLAPA